MEEAKNVEAPQTVVETPPENVTAENFEEPVKLLEDGPVDSEAFAIGIAAADATLGEAALPAIPAGAVPSVPAAEFSPTDEGSEEVVDFGGEETIAPRYLGETGPEQFDFVALEEGPFSFGDIMIQLVDVAIESESKGNGESITGETVAQIFCRGDVEDERVAFLLLLLGQNRPITASLILAAARAQGYEELVEQATLVRTELERAGDISVEQLVASSGTFQAVGVQEAVS